MKSAPLPAGGYRNEAVFRSAQRLLASRTDFHTSSPARWPLFAAGVGLGLVIALAIVLRVTRVPAQVGPAVVTTTFDLPQRDQVAAGKNRARTETGPASPPVPAVVTPVSEVATTTATLDSEQTLLRGRATLPSPAHATAPVATSDPAAVQAALLAVMSDVLLRGELQSRNGPPLSVALNLRRLGTNTSVAGRIEFYEKGIVTETRTVQGTLRDRMLTLREVGPYAWNPNVPFGHRFTLTLPERAAGGEVRGEYVVNGSTTGGRGTVVLAPALPW